LPGQRIARALFAESDDLAVIVDDRYAVGLEQQVVRPESELRGGTAREHADHGGAMGRGQRHYEYPDADELVVAREQELLCLHLRGVEKVRVVVPSSRTRMAIAVWKSAVARPWRISASYW
jgi:hypothetical protein